MSPAEFLAQSPASPLPFAFRSDGELVTSPDMGLTKREYFAAIAMQGLMGRVWNERGVLNGQEIVAQWAASAVACADALIAELAK